MLQLGSAETFCSVMGCQSLALELMVRHGRFYDVAASMSKYEKFMSSSSVGVAGPESVPSDEAVE